MATILEFRGVSKKGKAEPARSVAAQPCEVVLFPGVRYERWEEPGIDFRRRATQQHERLDILD